MGTILAALAFLTRIPVRATAPMPASLGAAAFGLVGAVLGLVAAIPLLLVGDRAPWVAALLAVAVLAVASGGLHLDGLADTADALVAHGSDRAERARKDPAIGAAGAVALVLVLGLEAASLAQLVTLPEVEWPLPIGPGAGTAGGPVVAAVALVLAASWGRATAVVLALRARRLAGDDGLAARFAGALRPADAAAAALLPVALAVGAGIVAGSLPIAVGLAAGLGIGALLARLVVRIRGRLDGDGLGAGVELAQGAVLVAAAIALAPVVGPA